MCLCSDISFRPPAKLLLAHSLFVNLFEFFPDTSRIPQLTIVDFFGFRYKSKTGDNDRTLGSFQEDMTVSQHKKASSYSGRILGNGTTDNTTVGRHISCTCRGRLFLEWTTLINNSNFICVGYGFFCL